ncbi:P-loop NTPase fold protein [Actinomycetes bacterium KLBMP 9797]
MSTSLQQQGVTDLAAVMAATRDREAHLRREVEALLVAGDEFRVAEADRPAVIAEVLEREEVVWREVRTDEQACDAAIAQGTGGSRSAGFSLWGAVFVVSALAVLIVADVVNWPDRSLQLEGGWWPVVMVSLMLASAFVGSYRNDLARRQRQTEAATWAVERYLRRITAESEMLLRFVLNERAGDAAAHGALLMNDRAPTLVELNDYPDVVPSSTYRRLALFIGEHRTSAIGLAGPRGAGKTTTMLSILRDPEIDCIGIYLPTPVHYDAPDYLRLIELRLAEKLLGAEDVDPGTFPKLWRDQLVRPIRAALAGTIWPVVLLASFTVLFLDHYEGLQPKTTVSLTTLLATVAGAVAVANMIRIAWRYITRRDRQLRTASPVARLAYERLMRLRWQAAITRTAKATGTARWFTGEMSSEIAHTERERSHPENVEDLRHFLGQVAEHTGRPVIVCVDELDKIANAQKAVDFVNALKDLFHVNGTHFIVSVSTDAMHSFAARGVPVRDVFDSSLDSVVPVTRLSYAESRMLLTRRVLYFPDAAAVFCHAWSGGHPRDLIRAARTMVEGRRDAPGAAPIVQLVDSIVRTDVAETLEAGYGALPPTADDDTRLTLITLLDGVRQPESDLSTLIEKRLPSVTVAASADSAPALLAALPSYLRLAADIWAIFTVPRSPRQWRSQNEARGIIEIAEALATVRWVLSIRPLEARVLLEGDDLRALVEHNRTVQRHENGHGEPEAA